MKSSTICEFAWAKPMLFLFLFFFLLDVSAPAQDLWPSPLSDPLFVPAPPLILPGAADDDQLSAYVPTLGELRKALAYKNGYDQLLIYTNDVIVPAGNQIANQYNKLLFRYKCLLVGTAITSVALIIQVIAR